MDERYIVESLSLLIAGASALVSLLMLVVVMIKLRGNGNGKGRSALTEGERSALFGSSNDARELRAIAGKQTEILEQIARSQLILTERFQDYARAVNDGLPKYVCRYRQEG